MYLVRHCQPEGQEPSAALTEEGIAQAARLCAFLSDLPVERIVSSPYARALESIAPLGERLGIEVEVDGRLAERVLSTVPLPSWRRTWICRSGAGNRAERRCGGRAPP